MDIPKRFNSNEFSFSNNSVLKLYDVLSVIEFSLELIKQHGRHEFQPVIMQQLRMIYTKGNDYYEGDRHEKKGLTKEENSFALFDIIGSFIIKNEEGKESSLKDAKLFPEITLKRREYKDLLKSHRFYYFTEDSIIAERKYTFEEFLKQDLIEVKDAEGNVSYKNIKQCINWLANKSQGAHYQVYIRKVQLDVIQRLDIISQTLGEVTLKVIMPICREILLNEDKEIGSSMNADYMKREKFIGLNVHNATPIFD